jgi:replicative DNA helicase
MQNKNNWLEAKREREKIEAAGKAALGVDVPKFYGQDLEMAILGACMLDHDALKIVISLLPDYKFAEPQNERVYQAMKRLTNKGLRIDMITVFSELQNENEHPDFLQKGGNAVWYIVELTNRVTSAANIEYHCQILLDIDLKRNLNAAAFEVIQAAKDPNLAAFDLLDLAKSRINEAEQRRDKVLGKDFDLDAFIELSLNGLAQKGYDVSRYLGQAAAQKMGLLDQNEMTVLAGRPGSGKTSIALQIAVEAALDGEYSVFVTYEMTTEQVYMRAICQMAEVVHEDWKIGRLNEAEKARILAATKRLKAAPLKIVDMCGQDVNALSYKLLEMHREREIKVLTIDYLGMIPKAQGEYFGSKNYEIEYNSAKVRDLTKKLKCTTILLVQMSRAADKDGNRLPQMSDLRDSGAIEQDAARVAFVHRHEYFGILEYEKTEATEEGESTAGKALLIVRKNRYGNVGIAKLAFQGLYTKFAPAETFDFSQIQPVPTFAPRVPKEANFDDDVPF